MGSWKIFDSQTPNPSRLFFLCDDLVNVIVCALGCALSGRAFAVLPPSTPDHFLTACQQAICPDFILSNQDMAKLISSQQPDFNDLESCHPQALFYIGLSSGSTGLPKAVVRTLASWEESFFQLEQKIQLKTNHVGCVLGNLSFSLSVFSALQVIYSGACLCLPTSQNISKITHLFSAPATLKLFLTRFPNLSFANLKMLVVGGDFCTHDILQFKAPQAQIAYFYGTVELSFIAFQILQENSVAHQVGHLFDGVQIRFENEQIFVKSSQSCAGYLEQGKLQRISEWVASGDLGYFDENQKLCIQGRIARQFLINGIIVYPETIENQLKQLVMVKQCVVFKTQTKSGYDELCAVLVMKAGSKKRLRQECQKHLLQSQIPKRFFLTDSLPQTHAGKIDFSQIHASSPFLQTCIKL